MYYVCTRAPNGTKKWWCRMGQGISRYMRTTFHPGAGQTEIPDFRGNLGPKPTLGADLSPKSGLDLWARARQKKWWCICTCQIGALLYVTMYLLSFCTQKQQPKVETTCQLPKHFCFGCKKFEAINYGAFAERNQVCVIIQPRLQKVGECNLPNEYLLRKIVEKSCQKKWLKICLQ